MALIKYLLCIFRGKTFLFFSASPPFVPLSLWTDLTNELQSAVTAYETYWKLNYSCTPDQFIYPSEKIDKIRSLRQSIVNYQKKIDKLPKSTTVYKRNQRYHRVKDIINNFYYQENIKNDREWYRKFRREFRAFVCCLKFRRSEI